MNKVNLHITVGLPASGKSTFAKEFIKKNPSFKLIDIDAVKDADLFLRKRPLIEILQSQIQATYNYRKDAEIFLDALILTNDEIGKILFEFAQFYEEVIVTIHYWNENREVCLKNDGGRRETPSTNTILNAPFEKIDEKIILEKIKSDQYNTYNVKIDKIIYRDVVLKEEWYRFFRPLTWIDQDKKLRSGRWCAGGSYGNCWDNTQSPVTPDDPLEFTQFDDLLIKICPNLNFIDYKKIRKQCVSTEETYESDYYGGGTTNLNWVCDLEQLFKVLNEYGYNIAVAEG